MSAEPPLIVLTWPVGKYSATLTVPRTQRGSMRAACIEWAPGIPQRLTEAEIEQYRAGRNQALAELARSLGGTVAVVDV